MKNEHQNGVVTGNGAGTEQVETSSEQAETRIEQARTRAEQAETQTKQAKTRTEQAKTRTEQAETRMEQAKTWTMEQALRASELSYRRLFEMAQDGILILDVDTGRINDVNPFLIDLLGFPRSEMVGKTVGELSPFKDILSNQVMLERLQLDGYVRYEDLPMETKDGRKIAVEFVSNVYQAGDKKVIQCNIRDITDRRALEALRESEEKFRNLFESSRDAIMTLEPPAWKFTSGNPTTVKMFGAKNEEEFISHGLRELSPDRQRDGRASAEKSREMIETAMRVGFHFFEWTHRRIGGEEFPADVLLTRIEQGGNVIVQATVRDITERKRADEVQRASDARFATVFRVSPLSIAISRLKDGAFVDVNGAWEKVTGFTREEVVGRKGVELKMWVNPDQRERLVRNLRERGAMQGFEVQIRRKSGAIRDFLMSAEQFDFAGEPCMLTTAMDITERKQTEEALRQSEEQFRAMFDLASVGIAQADPRTGQWLSVNRKMCEITGYSAGELLQLHVLDITHPEDRQSDREAFERVVRGESPDYRMEKRYIRKDGALVWVNVNMTVLRDAAGQPTRTMAVIEDINERRKLKAQFIEAQKMEAVGQLAGGVAHDFNNIIAVIMGYDNLIMADLEADSPLRKYADEIQHATERAAGLTRQLLVFSRKQTVQPVVLDLNDAVKDLDKMLRRLVDEHIEMTVVPGKQTGRIKADPGYIWQVLMNLVVNARDAMPNGGKLTIATKNVMLDGDYARTHRGVIPGNYVMMSVSDTGTGMTDEVKARMFEAFFTTKPEGKGTGLGLATCQTIVQQSGGHIDVDSSVGRGTTFKIYFPQVDESLDTDAKFIEVGSLPRGTETLLVVEDEPVLRQLAQLVLEAQGYNVLRAANGQEALSVAREHKGPPIRLVVTDVVMPQMGGKVMAEWLKTTYPDLKILFTSGYTDDALAKDGVLEPGVAFLPKPYKPGILIHKVREELDKPIAWNPNPAQKIFSFTKITDGVNTQ